MPYTLPYTALVTPAEVQEAATGGVRVDATGQAELVGRAIEAVTEQIEGYLNRQLIVRSYRQRLITTDYRQPSLLALDGDTYAAPLLAWPAVEIVTASTGLEIYDDGRFVVTTAGAGHVAYDGTVTYFAGYRRADQTLETLQTVFPTLTVLPEQLPGDIRDFAVDAVLARLNERSVGVGLSDTEIDAGASTLRRRGVTSRWSGGRLGSWWDANVVRIHKHRHFTA